MFAADMNDPDFMMYAYKVTPCPLQERHHWSACPHAHRGERAARRCPRTYQYSPDPCPEYSKRGTCPQGNGCPLAHSVYESWLHPSRFRTQLCCFGSSCRRRICFFAHDPSQLRTPAQTLATPSAAAGAPVMRRTQAVVPAALLGAMPAGPSALAQAMVQQQQQAQAQAQQQQQQQQQQAAAASMYVSGLLPQPACPQQQQQQPSTQLPTPQQQLGPSMPAWLYTGAGWVQHPAGMAGSHLLVPMLQQPQPQPPAMAAAAAAAVTMAQSAAIASSAAVSVEQTMLSGLAAGLQGLVLQDQPSGVPATRQPELTACTMLPPAAEGASSELLYRAGSSTSYAVPGSGAVGSGSAPTHGSPGPRRPGA